MAASASARGSAICTTRPAAPSAASSPGRPSINCRQEPTSVVTEGTPAAKPSSTTSGSASEIELSTSSPHLGSSSSIFWKPRNFTLSASPRLSTSARHSCA